MAFRRTVTFYARVFDFPPSDLMRPLNCRSADLRMRMQNALLLRKVASADNRLIFYRACVKFVTRFARKINRQVCRQMARVSREYKNYDYSDLLCKTHARLIQCSKPVKNSEKKNVF